MSTPKPMRPAFQSVELDPIDARLEARAAEKGIPTLVAPPAPKAALPRSHDPSPTAAPAEHNPPTAPMPRLAERPSAKTATPRKRMKGLKVELPDYAWVALKMRAAEEMTSIRFFIMEALRAKGIFIEDVDMVQDGRRFRN